LRCITQAIALSIYRLRAVLLGKMNAQGNVPAVMGRGKFVLPHEDEWEYACRGGKGNRQPFYFGDRLNGYLSNCDGNNPYGTETKG